MSEELMSRTIIQEDQKKIIKENIWKRLSKFSLETKKSTRKSRKTKDKNLMIKRSKFDQSMSSNKKTREDENLESIKQKSKDEIEIYSSTNKVFSSKLKLKITKSSRISTSIKTSFVSSIEEKISKTISRNQSIIIISQTLQVSSIELISSITSTSRKEINKKRKMSEESNIKTFWKKNKRTKKLRRISERYKIYLSNELQIARSSWKR